MSSRHISLSRVTSRWLALLVILAKGKFAAAELASLIMFSTLAPSAVSSDVENSNPKTPKCQIFRRIALPHFTGNFCLRKFSNRLSNSFRPPVLRSVDMYLFARETTYIVGPSGCGKFIIGAPFSGSTLFLLAKTAETCSSTNRTSTVSRPDLGAPSCRRRRTRLHGPECTCPSGKCTLEHCTWSCRKRSAC